MADTPRVTPSVVSLPEAGLRATRTVREVRAQTAIATDGADSLEMRTALKRLSRILASDQPLRTNVPRGFYLSFTI